MTATDRAGSRMSRLALPAVSLVLGATTAVAISLVAGEYRAVVLRLGILALLALALGLAIRSERVVAVATAPTMIALVIAAAEDERVAWGTALVAGCCWYVATEAALESIQLGGGLVVAPAVLQQRLNDVAIVVVLAAGVGLVGFAVASTTPTRTVGLQAALLAAVLLGLLAVVRRLAATMPVDGQGEPGATNTDGAP